jgi:hypothetical protein
MVFDREGYGCEFFHTLLENQVCFVTWEKYIDTHKLDAFNRSSCILKNNCVISAS